MGNSFHYYSLQKDDLKWVWLLTCICPQEALIHTLHFFHNGHYRLTEMQKWLNKSCSIVCLLMMDRDFPWITLKIVWFLQISFSSFFTGPASHSYTGLPMPELAFEQAWKTEQSFTKYCKNSCGGHSIILLKMWERAMIARGKRRTEHVPKMNEVLTSHFINGQSQLRWQFWSV